MHLYSSFSFPVPYKSIFLRPFITKQTNEGSVFFIFHCSLFFEAQNAVSFENICSQYWLANIKMHLRLEKKKTSIMTMICSWMQFHN